MDLIQQFHKPIIDLLEL